MNAYDIMHEWDRAMNIGPRTNADLDREIPPQLGADDYEAWKARLETRDVSAITQGMRLWGLPIAPLGQFEVDADMEVIERPYEPEEQ